MHRVHGAYKRAEIALLFLNSDSSYSVSVILLNVRYSCDAVSSSFGAGSSECIDEYVNRCMTPSSWEDILQLRTALIIGF